VARTRSRPIPSGQVTVRQALVWMCAQALVAFGILLTFNGFSILLGIAALLPVAIYPFMKRVTWWPQIFLGVAFNWGHLIGWSAHAGSLDWPPVVLYAGGIAWTLFYDTIYACQDKEDDALIGVKSTARLFGRDVERWLFVFLVASVMATLVAGVMATVESTTGALIAAIVVLNGGMGMMWGFIIRRVIAAAPPAEKDRTASLLPITQQTGFALGAALTGLIANGLGIDRQPGPAEMQSVAFWMFAGFVPLALLGNVMTWRFVGRQRREAGNQGASR